MRSSTKLNAPGVSPSTDLVFLAAYSSPLPERHRSRTLRKPMYNVTHTHTHTHTHTDSDRLAKPRSMVPELMWRLPEFLCCGGIYIFSPIVDSRVCHSLNRCSLAAHLPLPPLPLPQTFASVVLRGWCGPFSDLSLPPTKKQKLTTTTTIKIKSALLSPTYIK